MAAISRISAGGRPDAVAALADAGTDSDPRVRARTAYALGRLGDPAAIPSLLHLLQDQERPVRDQARDALGEVGGSAAVDALLPEAAGQDSRSRAQAAKALAKAVDTNPRVEPHLMALTQDHEASVRAAVLSGPATVANRPARWSAVAVTLAGDADAMVRQRAAMVAHHLAQDDAGAILHRLTDNPEATVRQVAAGQLRR